ncbi:MAG: hypothetical protein Kow0059_09920 [Candidatus Sumerlaeia bacterium]
MNGSPIIESRPLITLVVLSGLLFCANVATMELWGKDEFRYAEVAKEMLVSGNWLIPQINYQFYPDKPPVYFWTAAALMKVLGWVSPVAPRLPLALSAIGCVVWNFLIGRLLFDERVAFVASLMLMTSPRFYWTSQMIRLDIPLCFFMFAAMWAFVKFAWLSDRPHAGIYLFWAATGLACLSKGPPGLFTVLCCGVFLILVRDRDLWRRWRFFTGMALLGAIVGAWLVPAALAYPEFVHTVLFEQIGERVMSPWRHQEPFFFYILKILTDFAPWIFLLILPPLLRFDWKAAADRKRLLFLLCWAIIPFLAFSAIKGKRPQYILIIYPALCLLVAVWWRHQLERAEGAWRGRGWKAAGILSAIVGGTMLVLAGLSLVAGVRLLNDEFPSVTFRETAILAALLAAGAVVAIQGTRRRGRRPLESMAFGIYIVMTGVGIGLLPRVSSAAPYRRIDSLLEEGRRRGARLIMVSNDGKIRPNYLYFGTYPLEFVDRSDKDTPSGRGARTILNFDRDQLIYCVVRERDWRRFDSDVRRPFRVAGRFETEDDVVLVLIFEPLSQQAAPTPTTSHDSP